MGGQLDISDPSKSPNPRRPGSSALKPALLLALLASSACPAAMAQSCISLAGSTMCPAFNQSSISTNQGLVSIYPFLAFVSSRSEFDERLSNYISTAYVQTKYEQLLGCSGLNFTNTTHFYARYTASNLCNGIVQNSKTPCSLSEANARPLCAESCALFATSEQQIISNSQLCSKPNAQSIDQIRADFTVCALPSNSLSGNCIDAASNEPQNCGYSSNLVGLCAYCAKSSPNATDTCCYNSNVTSRCTGVTLPSITSLPPLFTTTVTPGPVASATESAAASSPSTGLSGGAIAGIVIGAVVGLALITALLAFCIFRRRKHGSQNGGSIFNQPSPQRRGTSMAYNPVTSGPPQQGYEVLPGGRIARMSALEGHSGSSAGGDAGRLGRNVATTTAAGAIAGAVAGDRRRHQGSSDEYGDSPESQARSGRGPLQPPHTNRRNGSLSSGSALGGEEHTSPISGSGADFSSPQGVASQQSEQLLSFKDYYSEDEIHPNDKVATLWAYQPRAGDEFELERGDMLKVVGIWDDGWATGVRLNDRAEDWDSKRAAQRDSGVSNGSGRHELSPTPQGDIKAFPLVCVCLPQHWKKTIDGDGSNDDYPNRGQFGPQI
ncbi:MAG: hypothetical protein M1829_004787 [Trizodia sp. TS-e1964]|nr:MAG: hypothetical protein M1829_004787 [Trizodia sp. TS-e1964]